MQARPDDKERFVGHFDRVGSDSRYQQLFGERCPQTGQRLCAKHWAGVVVTIPSKDFSRHDASRKKKPKSILLLSCYLVPPIFEAHEKN
jgi:hypothetical protein